MQRLKKRIRKDTYLNSGVKFSNEQFEGTIGRGGRIKQIGLGILMALILFPACTTGKKYEKGILRNENTIVCPLYFRRNSTHVSYSLIYDDFVTCGSSFAGNQYADYLFGAATLVNIPGLSWVFYPFQYADARLDSKECEPFGAGSGYGDFRVSLLWGFISLGRNWNIFWLNGFWHPGNDPLYHEKSQKEEIQVPADNELMQDLGYKIYENSH